MYNYIGTDMEKNYRRADKFNLDKLAKVMNFNKS